jgi:PKHD-type hydroxylase
MILCIAEVLQPREAQEMRERLAQAEFQDGKATAGWHARLVKNNLQTRRGDPALEALRDRIRTALLQHPVLQLAARPKALTPLILSRYEAGMTYGSHVDDALMAGLRSDLSFTLFLAAPDDYEGGELVMEDSTGEQPFKLPAGSLLLYPSNTLHRVAEVTRGTRLAAVGWIRSYVREPAQRELLFELDTARQRLFDRHGKTPEFDLLTKTAANLLRMWADD